MHYTIRGRGFRGFTKKVTLYTAAFVLAVSSLTASVPFILSQSANAVSPTTIHTSNLADWYAGDTRSSGFNELVADGVRAWTVPTPGDPSNAQSKAALYRAAQPGLTLAEVNQTSIEFASYSGVRPSVQLGIDRDGNGTWDGYLVYEPWAYGEGQYWVNRAGFGVPAGGGYLSMGTLAQYQEANPDAKVLSVGYSLGSGVIGDAVIKNIVIGSTTYTFAAPAPDTEKPVVTRVSPTTSVVAAGTNIVITASDNVGLNKIVANVYKDGVSGVFKPAQVSLNGSASGSLTVGTDGFANGAYNVKFNALDTANNLSSTQTFNFTIDNNKPVIAVKGAQWGNAFTPASIGQGNVFKEVNFKLNDNDKVGSVLVNGFNKVITPATWTDVNGVKVGSVGGMYGNNTIRVFDQAGNESVYDFVLDNKAPTVTVKENPATIGSGPYQKVSLKLYDEYKIDKAEINGTLVQLSDNQWSDLNNIAPGSMHGVAGTNTVKVWDVVGNVTELTFVLDVTAPNAIATFSNNNGNAVTNQDVVVTLTANEPIVTPEGWTPVGTDALVFTKSFGANGWNTVVLQDLAGNSSSKTFEVKRIDKTNPSILGVQNGQTYRGEVSFTVNDQNFSRIFVNDNPVASTGLGGWNYGLTEALSGNGTYDIRVTDKGGNETLYTIFIDNSVAVELEQIDLTSSTPEIRGTLTYVADGAVAPGAYLLITVGSEQYPVETDDNGVFNTPVTAVDGSNVLVVNLSDENYQTLTQIYTETFVSTLPIVVPDPDPSPNPQQPQPQVPSNPDTAPVDGGTVTVASVPDLTTPNNGLPFANFGTVVPQVFGVTTPQTDATEETEEAVEGTNIERAAQAVDADNNDGVAFGLAWYWWLLIILAAAGILWGIIAAFRRRGNEA